MRSDVVVVGAGPSGAVCALELARAGLSVIVLERAVFPRRKVCGEYLNCGTIDQLKSLGLYRELEPKLHPLRSIRLHTAGMSIQLPFRQAAAALERATFDDFLLRAAGHAGVQIITGRMIALRFSASRISGIVYEDVDGRQIIDTNFVIGADGCGSLVARELGVTLPLSASRRYSIGGHFRSAPSDVLTMNIEKNTYIATNPLSENRMNVMLVAPQSAIRSSANDIDAWFEQRAIALQHEGSAFSINNRIRSASQYRTTRPSRV